MSSETDGQAQVSAYFKTRTKQVRWAASAGKTFRQVKPESGKPCTSSSGGPLPTRRHGRRSLPVSMTSAGASA
jgi:hypothetical protein